MPPLPSLPSPVRAALGLAATVLDEARHLPDRAIELPMRAVSTALKLSLRAQQRYAELAARGDEVLSGRSTGDEPPAWATFDAPVDAAVDALVDAPLDDASLEGEAAEVTPVRRPSPVRAVPTAKTVPAARPAAKTARASKPVRAPRTGKRSAFDAVSDDALDQIDPAAPVAPGDADA